MNVKMINPRGNSCCFCDRNINQQQIIEMSGAGLKVRACDQCINDLKVALEQVQAYANALHDAIVDKVEQKPTANPLANLL
jgi:hypothetical protein